MALFSTVFRQLSERFAPLRETLQKRAAQELTVVEKPPEERQDFDFLAKDRKCRNNPEKRQLGERDKNEGKINKRGSHKEVDRETLSLEDIKITMNGRVHQKKREMHSLEKLMEGRSELKIAGKKKRKKALPLLVEVKPRPTPVRSSVLKPIEEGEPKSAAHPSLPCVPLHVDPPKPFPVPPRPTPAPDDLFSLRRSSSQVRPPKRLPPSVTPTSDEAVALRCPASRKPRPSPFKAPLMLVDIEDEESEYVEYTGKNFRVSGLCKSERLRMPEAERKPTKTVAWLEKETEKEREVQEEVWTSEVEELQGFEDDPKNETQHKVNVQEEVKRKGPFFLFTGAEKKAEKQREKRIIEENRRQRKRELKLERLMSDPKLKHVWMNRHNLHCNC